MSNPRWPAIDLSGAASRPGPSPEAVAAMAQRVARAACDMDALRLQLSGLLAIDWSSPAASAFRASLSSCTAALAQAVQKVELAAITVGSYGLALQDESASCSALNPNLPLGARGGTEFGPRFGQGFGPDWGAGF